LCTSFKSKSSGVFVFRAPLIVEIVLVRAFPPAPAVTVADCVALPAPQDNGVVTEMVAETTWFSNCRCSC
jgi:hypothetical protein